MNMEKVVLGLGSNSKYNDLRPVQILAKACGLLEKILDGFTFSSIYRTAAMYVTDQEDFYNMVVSGNFCGTPRELLDEVHSIENLYGRNRTKEIRFGPRPLDIDIEMFGNQKICEPDLVIPHERMTERAFVLVPYLEILEKDAETVNGGLDFYKDCLLRLSEQRIDLFMDRCEFEKLVNV